MTKGKDKVLQYLDEAHAHERALVSVLTSQIAMTPRGSYRSALETHLRETRDHAERVGPPRQARGGGSGPPAPGGGRPPTGGGPAPDAVGVIPRLAKVRLERVAVGAARRHGDLLGEDADERALGGVRLVEVLQDLLLTVHGCSLATACAARIGGG